MRGKIVYPYSEELLKYKFSESHPLRPERLRLTYELSRLLGLIDKVDVISPTPATREELELFHTPDYIDAVIACAHSNDVNARYGLGIPDNPIFPEIYDAARWYVGATLDAARAILRGASNAFVISGGLHHSQRSEASGFCIFNDIVLAIMLIQKKRPCRVLYYDFDAHHGDGVQNAFYRTDSVLTISVHQTGRTLFPGTGFVYESGGGEGTGYAVNIPLLPGASSPELIKSFDEIVVPLFESYRPDLLVTQMGVDGHHADPLANLAFTSHGYEYVVRRLKKMSDDICGLGWLALGGGGYNIVNVARLWTLFLALMQGEEKIDSIPEEFIEKCRQMGYTNCPTRIRDDRQVVEMYLERREIELDLERTIRRIKELVFPYHGLS